MKKILALVALVVAASPLAFGQTTQSQSGQAATSGQKGGGTVEQEVEKVGRAYDEAYIRGDSAALDRIWADDYTSTSNTGEVTNKAKNMELIKSGDLKVESGQADDVRLHVYGDTAVVTSLWTSKGKYKGKDFNQKERYTVVFVKRDGRWQVVAEQGTLVAAQPQGQQQQSAPQSTEKKP